MKENNKPNDIMTIEQIRIEISILRETILAAARVDGPIKMRYSAKELRKLVRAFDTVLLTPNIHVCRCFRPVKSAAAGYFSTFCRVHGHLPEGKSKLLPSFKQVPECFRSIFTKTHSSILRLPRRTDLGTSHDSLSFDNHEFNDTASVRPITITEEDKRSIDDFIKKLNYRAVSVTNSNASKSPSLANSSLWHNPKNALKPSSLRRDQNRLEENKSTPINLIDIDQSISSKTTATESSIHSEISQSVVGSNSEILTLDVSPSQSPASSSAPEPITANNNQKRIAKLVQEGRDRKHKPNVGIVKTLLGLGTTELMTETELAMKAARLDAKDTEDADVSRLTKSNPVMIHSIASQIFYECMMFTTELTAPIENSVRGFICQHIRSVPMSDDPAIFSAEVLLEAVRMRDDFNQRTSKIARSKTSVF
jgi:hypothetical protein